MKRSRAFDVSVVTVGLLLGAGWAAAQQATAAGSGTARIAVVDVERLAATTALGKQYAEGVTKAREELRAESATRQAAMAKLDERLKQQQESLAKEQAGLSPAVAEQRQQAVTKLAREREAYRQDSEDALGLLQRKLQREQQRIDSELQEKLVAFVQSVTAERNIDLVLDRRVCLAVGPSVDITDEVLRRADGAQAQAGTTPAAKPKPRP
jgi:Skp family chaperone for outer membrane proteins